MRAFELQVSDLLDPGGRWMMIVDLDSIVRFKSGLDAGTEKHYVVFSDGDQARLTKSAFDKILLAWKSK